MPFMQSLSAETLIENANFRHNDFPWSTRNLLQNDLSGLNFNMNLSTIEPWASYSLDHTDLPRLREGRVGGQVKYYLAA